MKSEVPQSDLQRVKDEIRIEAEALRLRTPAVKPRPIPAKRAYDTSRREYSIAELAQFHFTTFVDHAYRALLKRPPDPAGFDAHVRLLISGGSKIEVLGNLRFSAEGRALGVRVRNLLPMYALTKLYRVPVVGYASEWIVALYGLPKMVRFVRAVDTVHYSRSYEIDAAGRALKQTVAELRENSVRLVEDVAVRHGQFEQQYAGLELAMRTEQGVLATHTEESRHLVLSMNHWLTSLRQNLAALEAAEHEQRRRADALLVDVIEPTASELAGRAARFDSWIELLAAHIAPRSRVLDLAGGRDWLARIAGRGFDASGVDSNSEIRARARADGLLISPGSPAEVLARTADGALDALTVLAVGSVLRRIPAATLFDATRRTLKPGGLLLLAFDNDAGERADRLAGAADSVLGADLLTRALAAAGFIDITRTLAADGSVALLAHNPAVMP